MPSFISRESQGKDVVSRARGSRRQSAIKRAPPSSEIKALVEGLEIPVEFAMLGASNPVMLQGRLLKQRAQIVATLDRVIEEIGEDKLRLYRTNLKHL